MADKDIEKEKDSDMDDFPDIHIDPILETTMLEMASEDPFTADKTNFLQKRVEEHFSDYTEMGDKNAYISRLSRDFGRKINDANEWFHTVSKQTYAPTVEQVKWRLLDIQDAYFTLKVGVALLMEDLSKRDLQDDITHQGKLLAKSTESWDLTRSLFKQLIESSLGTWDKQAKEQRQRDEALAAAYASAAVAASTSNASANASRGAEGGMHLNPDGLEEIGEVNSQYLNRLQDPNRDQSREGILRSDTSGNHPNVTGRRPLRRQTHFALFDDDNNPTENYFSPVTRRETAWGHMNDRVGEADVGKPGRVLESIIGNNDSNAVVTTSQTNTTNSASNRGNYRQNDNAFATFQQSSNRPVDNQSLVRSNMNNGPEANAMLFMFSQSLASTFNIRTIIPTKFSGDPAEFYQFELLWQKANSQMDAMHFSKPAKFWELKKVVQGPALTYLHSLPPAAESSYAEALKILMMLYKGRKSSIKDLVKGLISLPNSKGSYKDRLKFHSAIVSYKQAIRSIGGTAEDVLLAVELCLIEAKMDESWKKEWFKFCAKRQNFNAPLGYDVTFQDLVQLLHESMIQQINMATPAPTNFPQITYEDVHNFDKGEKKDKKPKAKPKQKQKALTAKVDDDKSSYEEKTFLSQGGDVKVNCKICEVNGKQKYTHPFPLNCPLILKNSPNKLSDDEIKSQVSKKNLCRNCFQEHHSRDCNAPAFIKCKVKGCKGRHHVTFHQ